ITVHSIKVSPDPPKAGENLTVVVTGTVGETIEEGAWADVKVKLGLIQLLKKEFDLCEEARGANVTVQCPVEPGTYTIEQTVALPKEIPKAKFNVNVKAYNDDESPLLCLDIVIDFMMRFPGLFGRQ
ncbi:hypothetical protein M422DRAFT_176542, partial [Sphaerobolus stellatus SS14]